jgi:hypothetical protein
METQLSIDISTRENSKNIFLQYFIDFKNKAPQEFVNYGGYHTGQPNAMASSLESCLALYDYMEDKNATVLNAGAGASSAVLRSLLKNVTCTDPDKKYLEVVKEIVGGENYIHNIGYCDYSDYVYWDYGNWQRRPLMDVGLHLARKAMYVDDCHDPDVMSYVRHLVNIYGYKIVETKSLDNSGRFGVIIDKLGKR